VAASGKASGGGGGGAGGGKPAAPAVSGPRVDWSAIWPIPAVGLAAVLLGSGIVAGVMRAPKGDPAAPIAEARALVEAREFERGIAVLNDKAVAALRAGKLTPAQAGELFLLRARAVLAGQAELGITRKENFQFAIDDFKEAQRQGATLTPTDVENWALSLLALGQVDAAVEQARALGEAEAERREGILEKVVERNLSAADVRYEQTLALLTELAESPRRDAAGRAWALARQTELRLAMGYQEEAITRLLRALPRMEGVPATERGELLSLLGRAYFEAGQPDAARRQLEAAEELLDASSPVRAGIGVMVGRLNQAQGRLEPARERFQGVREQFPESAAALPATVGVAEVEAAGGNDDAAIEAYEAALATLDKGEPRRDVTWASLGESLMDRFTARANAKELRSALRYAALAERAYRRAGGAEAGGPGGQRAEVPAALLVGLGRVNRELAESTLEEARATEAGRLPIALVSPVTQAEVKRYLLDAGGYFREHARAVLIEDREAYAESLWAAAECFDLAGDLPSAREAFNAYAESASDDDPRRAEARFRQAQVFQAERDYATAASLYRALVDARGGAGVGPLSDRAMVPLAECYLADDSPENDARAVELLAQVVQGGVVSPESEVYRGALVELGEQMHRSGDYAQAARYLDEAVQRYPEHPRIHVLRYKLADSYRGSARQIERDLGESMPQDRRDELTKLRTERLRLAGALLQQVMDGLAKVDARQVTAMDKLAARNSAFYLADTAFDLGEYDRAIELYDQARQRHASDPASLIAMVQIVNAYVAQGKWSEAITANERARQQAAALPDTAWNDPTLPIGREHWERWLDSTRLIERQRSAEAGGGGAGGARADAGEGTQ
jgi:tetratricopeptide (TPR) repeat protein